MKFKTLRGGESNKNIRKFLIDWNKKSKSKIQKEVKDFLKKYWEDSVCYEEMVLAGERLSLDLVNLTDRVAVEVHGEQHSEFVKHFQGHPVNFLAQCERDIKKQKWCEINDFKLVEIYKKDLPLSEEWFSEREVYL